MSIIEADHYREEIKTHKADPIVKAMKEGLYATPLSNESRLGRAYPRLLNQIAWEENGNYSPNSDFMGKANAEYRRRGGTNISSIGGVARALIALLIEDWTTLSHDAADHDIIQMPKAGELA